MDPWTISIGRSQIWFKISAAPGQILPRDQGSAVQAYGFEIAQFGICEITVDMIHHELAGMFSHETAAIAGGFFPIA